MSETQTQTGQPNQFICLLKFSSYLGSNTDGDEASPASILNKPFFCSGEEMKGLLDIKQIP